VRRSLEESLDRLGVDRVDIALIHDPDDFMDQALDAYPALAGLRAQGTVRAIGAGMNSATALAGWSSGATWTACWWQAVRRCSISRPPARCSRCACAAAWP
jgi:aryl-alcohol dehydrogenase-like predicted oxidoreductase